MFLYQVKDLYDDEGNGPLKGLVIKTTPNGCKDMVPAQKDEVVVFFEETLGEVVFHDEFTVGEKLAHYIAVFLDEQQINDGDTVGDFTLSSYNFSVDTNIEDVEATSSNSDITVALQNGELSVYTNKKDQEVSGLISLSGGDVSVSFTVQLYYESE